MSQPKVAPVMSKGPMRLFTRLNVFVYRLSGGRLMNSMYGTPICLVTMTGAKTGKTRTIPLMYNPIGQDVVLVASLGGAPQNPLWYYNLVAHPDVEIQVGQVKRRMHCRQASTDEKEALWPAIVANFSSYGAYQRRTDRDIPVMICSSV
ncbi:nitroreductase family deazaflavin-dependent oxidoreductase [Emcibacter sp. SYSU 3D8]|uniref:nitroreductase family deazaflavin-dependent oxidoreductase n=1 Tax=Emcibacter sp. SYSU 3D8 TaxID=3133969 RepID=UPI0031FEBB69